MPDRFPGKKLLGCCQLMELASSSEKGMPEFVFLKKAMQISAERALVFADTTISKGALAIGMAFDFRERIRSGEIAGFPDVNLVSADAGICNGLIKEDEVSDRTG